MSKNRLRRNILVAANGIMILVAVAVVVWSVQRNQQDSSISNTCETTGRNYTIRLVADNFGRDRLTLAQCDTLTIINSDDLSYQLAFGIHSKHIAYPGYTATTLARGQHSTITMYKAGTFEFHDHFRDNARLTLTIEPAEKD